MNFLPEALFHNPGWRHGLAWYALFLRAKSALAPGYSAPRKLPPKHFYPRSVRLRSQWGEIGKSTKMSFVRAQCQLKLMLLH